MRFEAIPRDVQAVLAVVAAHPQGIAVSSLLSACLATGWIEPSPIFADRVRWARPDGPFADAAAHVRFRRNATARLAEIHEMSGLPVTLHVFVGMAHAVVERYPRDDVRSIAEETARYAHPRELVSGITSRVLVAFLPESARVAYVEASHDATMDKQLRSIRGAGYGYSRATPPIAGAVLSAVVRAEGGLPLGALCTFGSADTLSEPRAAKVGPRMVEIARSLAEESAPDVAVLQRRAAAAAVSLREVGAAAPKREW